MKILSAPLDICFGITNQCNLNCKHCLASATRNSKELTTDELLNIIDQIRQLKILKVAIFGGEPLIRKDFFIILEALAKLRIKITLNTNGTLITKETAERLSEYKIGVYTVSLDGSCAEVHDPFRGAGSFKKAVEGIQNLIARKCNVLISAVVTRFNYNDLENIVLLGSKLGAYRVMFNDVVYIGNAACYRTSLLMTTKEKFKLLDDVRALKDRFGDFMTGSVVQTCNVIEEIKHNQKETLPLKVNSCGAAVSKCAIRPDGYVTPCEIIWNVKAGNLKEKSLYDIWHNSLVMNAFREEFEIREEEIPECNGCDYLRLCYKGHRCQPYYNPGAKFEHKELYCWREDVISPK
ncbi:MAG: radical SAM protein [Candidatus Omnitrophota bacterium]|nr:radical SAM protein [Candidatus Omnitrophota bacterium]